MKTEQIQSILSEAKTLDDMSIDFNTDMVEVETFNYSYGSIDEIELSNLDDITIDSVDGNFIDDYVVYERDKLEALLQQEEEDVPAFGNVELAMLGEVIDSCLNGTLTMYTDGPQLKAMSLANIKAAIVSQFDYKLKNK